VSETKPKSVLRRVLVWRLAALWELPGDRGVTGGSLHSWRLAAQSFCHAIAS